MRIMVTGGAGFIGSHLVDRLVTDGHEIAVLDNLRRGKRENIQAHLEQKKITFFEQDIRNFEAIKPAFEGCKIVFHLAAQSNVMGAVTDIDYSFETNVVGTFNVLKAANSAGVRRVVFSSSREVYGEAQYLPVDEKHPFTAKNSYGASKAAGEKYCDVFQNMGAFETVILRFANVYGARDFARVIPIFINNLKNDENIRIFGGEQVIDFVSVEIIIEALVQSMSNERATEAPTNIGSGKGTTLFDLASRIMQLMGKENKITVEPAREAEVVKFTADVTRMNAVFHDLQNDDPLVHLPLLTSAM